MQDRRVCMVSLTDKGRGIVEEKRAAWQALWEEHLGGPVRRGAAGRPPGVRTMTDIIDEA